MYYFYLNKEELPDEWKRQSLFLSIRREIKKTVVIIGAYHLSLLLTTYKILSSILLSRLSSYAEEITGDHQCGFGCNSSTTDHTRGSQKP